MNAEIFITTYGKDAPWLEYCLRSIEKFATGFSGVTVLYPNRDRGACGPVCGRFPTVRQRTFDEVEGKGKVHQMAEACFADVWCPEADLIVHWDSDCIFTEPVALPDFCRDGKPVLQFLHYDSLPRLKPEVLELQNIPTDSIQYMLKWREVTERALGFATPIETMQAFPAVHYRSLYAEVRQRCEGVHHRPFMDYVLEQRNEFPQGFCEYNTLGGYAWEHFRDRYHWIDLECQPKPRPKVRQFWSHGGLARPEADGTPAVEILEALLGSGPGTPPCQRSNWITRSWKRFTARKKVPR